MKLYLQFAAYIMCSVLQLLLMCLSQAADSDCRMHDSTQQVNSNRATLLIAPEGNQCCPGYMCVCCSSCVRVHACLPLCMVEIFFMCLREYHHFLQPLTHLFSSVPVYRGLCDLELFLSLLEQVQVFISKFQVQFQGCKCFRSRR